MKRDMLEYEYDNTRCDDEDAIVEKQLIIPPQTFMRRHNKDIYNNAATRRSCYIADNIRSRFPYLNKFIYYFPNDEKYPEIPWTRLMLIYDTSIDEGERFVIEYI